MTESPRPGRIRIDLGASASGDAAAAGARAGATTRGIALPGAPGADADAVYARALRVSQLRLALGTVLGFVIVVVALALAIAFVPELEGVLIAGVPLSWVMQAFAYYPVIIVFAIIYARGARRNERRYRALRDRA